SYVTLYCRWLPLTVYIRKRCTRRRPWKQTELWHRTGTEQPMNGWRGTVAIDDPVRLDTRLAGQIKRYHTWPTIGQQTVAEHTWHLLRIYMSVVSEINPAVCFRIMFHDIGEHLTGDIPYPVKKENPSLRAEINALENRSYARQLDYWDALHHSITPITAEEETLMKQIEMMEMAEYGMEQVCLGCAHGWIVADRCLRYVYESNPPVSLSQYV